ncbi:MAG: hypothetical protein RIM83_19340, partial [Allomuricauda sp.]
MKKQFFQRLAATSFLIFLFLFSCEKEEPLPLDTDQDASADEGPYTLNSVDMEGIPKITDFLSSRAGKDIFKATATGKDDGAVINEEVIRVNDSLGHSNYSFHFTLPDSAENEFYNLVVGESEDGQPQEPTVFHYVCDPEYYEAFEQSGFDPIAFVGTISMYPFDQIFRDGSLSKDTCAEHDQYGDPIPCIRTNVTNGSSSSGAGGSMGGAQSSGGLPSPTTSSYSISVTVYHVVPDGRTFTYGSGSRCEHPGECQIIYEVSTKANNKATDRGCDKCPSAPGGVAANMASRTKLLVDGLRTKLSLSSSDTSFLLRNKRLVEDLSSYLNYHKNSSTAKNKVRRMVSEAKRGELLSVKPYIKYPMGKAKEYAQKYPKLTEYLKNQLPNVANMPKITSAIQDITGLSIASIKNDLQWGEGPEVHIIQLDNYDPGKTDEDTAGYFDKNTPYRILLDIDYVNLVENENSDPDALIFWIGTTVLHEYVHYGNFATGFEFLGEDGRLFETKVYGENVQPDRARIVLNR